MTDKNLQQSQVYSEFEINLPENGNLDDMLMGAPVTAEAPQLLEESDATQEYAFSPDYIAYMESLEGANDTTLEQVEEESDEEIDEDLQALVTKDIDEAMSDLNEISVMIEAMQNEMPMIAAKIDELLSFQEPQETQEEVLEEPKEETQGHSDTEKDDVGPSSSSGDEESSLTNTMDELLDKIIADEETRNLLVQKVFKPLENFKGTMREQVLFRQLYENLHEELYGDFKLKGSKLETHDVFLQVNLILKYFRYFHRKELTFPKSGVVDNLQSSMSNFLGSVSRPRERRSLDLNRALTFESRSLKLLNELIRFTKSKMSVLEDNSSPALPQSRMRSLSL